MSVSRYNIYNNFRKYILNKDNRSMDEICKNYNNEFKLQTQQLFLKDYMIKYPNWKNLLIYAKIGSGKTCTSITMAEQYLNMYPNNKILVILPARLRTNFIDELMSDCTMNKYINKEHLLKYQSSSTPNKEKNEIMNKFMITISAKYTILSFEKFKMLLLKNKRNLSEYINIITKNTLVIVDEVHNLLSENYERSSLNSIIRTGRIENRIKKGSSTILFILLNKFANQNTKFLFLTATPIFNHIKQLRELVIVMNPEIVVPLKSTLLELIELLRGKVSYFPGTSLNAYPKTKYLYHNVKLSKTQDDVIFNIQQNIKEHEEDSKDALLSKQRQASLACLPKNKKIDINNIDKVVDNMHEYCPKIEKLLEYIDLSGKHLIFSNFIQAGLNIIEKALIKKGWISIYTANEKNIKSDKIYAKWDGSTNDSNKQLIKRIVNNKNNIDGNKIKIILGSPSIKEGISFKHVQHMHILDPVWNSSAKNQIEGRVNRFCSHVDIDNLMKDIKRKVVFHIYKLLPREDGKVEKTSDQIIYDEIIPNKELDVALGEKALKKVSIDHYLFKKVYNKQTIANSESSNKSTNSNESNESENSPKSHNNSVKSIIDIEDLNIEKKIFKQKNLTCPKRRRPNKDTGLCPNDLPFKRNNLSNEPCCYKKDIKKFEENNLHKTCHKKRQPVNGKCLEEGFDVKKNKYNQPCCYKIGKNDKKDNVEKKDINKTVEKNNDVEKETICPKKRQPVNGKCLEENYHIENKNNRECCYKNTKKYLNKLNKNK